MTWAILMGVVLTVAYLGLSAALQRGPGVKITFNTADGLMVGTKVEHKAVELGVVTGIGVIDDLNRVEVRVRMTSEAEAYLTDQTRFWVVRPQLSGGSVTGLTTLLSGSTIEMDPGQSKGKRQTSFKGLETPPANRSDEPGTTYVLHAPTVSGLTSGTPIFYRDLVVGEVLNNTVEEGKAAVTAEIFVKSPYDEHVRTGTVFWQFSGISGSVTGSGLHVDVQSLQAALSGGLAFNTPPGSGDYPLAKQGTTYPLFPSEPDAIRASYNQRIPFVLYFGASAAGLAVGSPVQIYDWQIGEVTGLTLQADTRTAQVRVRVAIEVLPQRLKVIGGADKEDTPTVARRLVEGGMRASLETISYVTKAQGISFDFTPGAAPAQVAMEGGIMVLPTALGGAGGGLLASATGTVGRVNAMPIESLGRAIGSSLAGLRAMVGARNADKPITDAAAMLVNLQALVKQTNASLAPLLQSLPGQADALRQTLASTLKTLQSADLNYGAGSDRPESLSRQLAKYYDLARYVRLLADYLDRHPEGVVRGTTARGSE